MNDRIKANEERFKAIRQTEAKRAYKKALYTEKKKNKQEVKQNDK